MGTLPIVTNREVLVGGKKYDYIRLEIETPRGVFRREMVRHPGAVLVIPVLGDGRLVLIRNYRVTVERWLLEFCAGTIDSGEEPMACAGRELIEETGYRAGELVPLGWFYTTPGLTDERMYVFVARGVEHVGQKLEPDEMIEVLTLSPREVLERIKSGELIDGKSIAGLMMAMERGLVRR